MLNFCRRLSYDVAVVGGGPGGYAAAIRAAQLGLKTVCIEKRSTLGGTCLNVGCIPSKTLLSCTQKHHEAVHHFPTWLGYKPTGKVDLAKLMVHKSKCVTGLTKGIEQLFKAYGVVYERGVARLDGKKRLTVTMGDDTHKTIESKHLILAPGSESSPLPHVPVDEELIVSSTGALSLARVPKNLVVIGGGIIGLELGTVYARLGSSVTVVEFLDRICPSLDKEVATLLQRHLAKTLGFSFLLGSKVREARRSGHAAHVTIETGQDSSSKTLEADCVLLAVGRRPATEGLNIESLGVKLDSRGRIPVDRGLQVTENVYAIGDAIAGPMLAHKAEEEGIAVAEFLGGGVPVDINYDAIPSVVYTHPEVAGVGATEEQLRADGVEFAKATFPMAANSRTRATSSSSDGLVKLLTARDSGKLLGAWIMADQAGEMIHELALALHYGASAEDVYRVCHAHPTLGEAVKEAAMVAAHGVAIHNVPSKKAV